MVFVAVVSLLISILWFITEVEREASFVRVLLALIASILSIVSTCLVNDLGKHNRTEVASIKSIATDFAKCKSPKDFRAVDKYNSEIVFTPVEDPNYMTVSARSAGRDEVLFSEDDLVVSVRVLK